MPRATMSSTSPQGSDCQPTGELTVRQNSRGPAESQNEAITRCRQGEDAQGQPARNEGWAGGLTAAGGDRTPPPG